jgi:acylphosphatase
MQHSNAPQDRIHIMLSGKVKRVRFRLFVKQRAESLNLVGWVRNRLSNRVEIVAEGPRTSLERLSSLVREGPPGAEVSAVDITWAKGTGKLNGFRVRWLGLL